MACWRGQPLRLRHSLGCQHEGRAEPAGAAYLVRYADPLAEKLEVRQMKTPDSSKPESSAPNKRNFTATVRFIGTENLRHLRVIQALMTRPLPREQLDSIAGASNGPELVAELRRRGLETPCTRTKKRDRDLFDCWPGVYHFTSADRRRVNYWLAHRNG